MIDMDANAGGSKAGVSALMDGELDGHEAEGAHARLRDDGEARDAWRTYHLIGDAMRAEPALSRDFTARLSARLEREPAVLAPRPRRAGGMPAWAYALAASLAIVFAGGAGFFVMQQGVEPQAPVAATAPAAVPAAVERELAQVPPPEAANDYLLAHQGYSPRTSLQGAAPYVRTVSSEGVRR